MLAKQKPSGQLGFYNTFEEQLNRSNSLYILANEISWDVFEEAFKKHYSVTQGKPAKPIRLMVSLLILKQLRNLSDESVVQQWEENAYYQYFGGEKVFASGPPCVATELVEFRKRIGAEGVELILKESIHINGKDSEDGHLSGDTTVQEKNITYPTDDKLYKKIIVKCQQIADKEALELRQSYKFVVKKLSITQRLRRNKGGDAKARKANRKIKTIAGRLVRDVERKLTADALNKYALNLALFKKILEQKRSDSNKIYSTHEPEVKCYTKGKAHKRFEFGSKVSILVTQSTGVIVGALNFTETLHDSKTLPAALEQYERLLNKQPEDVFLDRGYRGPKIIGNTALHTPKPDKNISATKRKRHKRRAAIEPVIGHLKHDYRMIKNFLKGTVGDEINVMMAAAAMNFKRMMNKWKQQTQFFVHQLAQLLFLWQTITSNKNLKMTF